MRTPQLATRFLGILAVPLLLARVIAGVWPWRGLSRSGALAVAAVSVLCAVGLFAAPVAAVTVSITLKPAVGPPTTKVSVTGTGFGASETVAVDFSAVQVATATTSSTGTFSTTFTVPKPALPGKHPVTATGQTSGRSATGNFLVRTDWAKFHFDLANSGYNPYENVIGPSNVSGLKTAWTAPSIGSVGTPPAVAGGVVYVGSASTGKLYAFSAAGTTGCSGTPKTCAPLWTGASAPGSAFEFSSPAVAGGGVYVGSTDGKLYAFSAAGTTGCSGTPKTCTPLWTAATGNQILSSPAVTGGVVYVGSLDNKLYAFSATGTTGCSGTPKTCKPLWTAATPGGGIYSSPAVAGGVAFVGSADGNLYAFSAAGTTGCSGTPKTCTPLWTGNTSGGDIASSPAVAGGVVYAGSGNTGQLYAFSATGTTGCSGTPKTCTPLWTAATGNGISSAPAVTGGVAYVSSGDGTLYAFSATGTAGCSGTPKTCKPLWTAAGAGGQSSPAVANGVVYNGAAGRVYAFSAAGTTGCSGTPKTCAPLWTGGSSGITYASPAVANGMVYEGEWDAPFLYAFSR